jgi:mRNA interferase MazF
MLRGDIRLFDWAPARGSEAERRRPAVVLSNDAANAAVARLAGGVVAVVPVSRNVTRIFPFQVFLPAATTGLAGDSKAQAGQIRSVAAERLGRLIGRLSPTELAELDDALRLHLQL